MPRDSRDPLTDLLIQRAMTAATAFYDDLTDDIDRALRDVPEDSLEGLFQAARDVLFGKTDALTQLLADAELAAWINGAAEIAGYIPVPEEQPDSPFEYDSVSPGRWEWQGMDVYLPLVKEASEDLRTRQLVLKGDFERLDNAARQRAFTLANQYMLDAVGKVRDSLAEAVEEGEGFPAFREKINAAVEVSPLSVSRLENVFRNGVGQAMMNGKEKMAANSLVAPLFPYRMRMPIRDARLTELCRTLAQSGLQGTAIYRADDPSYIRYRPLSHFGCRCGARFMSPQDAAKRGIEEAMEYLDSGQWPTVPAWVEPPDVENLIPKGWTPGGGLDLSLRAA